MSRRDELLARLETPGMAGGGRVTSIATLAERVAKWVKRGAPMDDLPWKNRQEYYAALQQRPELLTEDFPEGRLAEKTFRGDSFVERALRDQGVGVRYERESAERASPNSHWDPVGGSQAGDRALLEPSYQDVARDEMVPDEDIWGGAQLRFSPLSGLTKGKVLRSDPNDGIRAGDYDPSGRRAWGNVLYPNEWEGVYQNNPTLSSKSFVDLIRDPGALLKGNYSLTVPFSSDLYKKARVLKAEGGAVEGSRARAAKNAPGFLDALGALSDVITGGLHGAAGVALGWPGDLEKLLAYELPELTSGKELSSLIAPASQSTLFPTSETVKKYLPQPTEFSIPAARNPFIELGSYAPISPGQVGRVARSTLGAAKRPAQWVGGLAAEAARRGVEEGRGPLGALTLMAKPQYAVRPRGGNFDKDTLASQIRGMENWVPEGTEDPVNAWLHGPFAKYIAKDLGAPTDPLLQLEKELPGLHFSPEALEGFAVRAQRVNRMPPVEEMPKAWLSPQMTGQTPTYAKQAAAHRALTDQPLTPWGAMSDAHLSSEPVLRRAALEEGLHGYDAPEYLRHGRSDEEFYGKWGKGLSPEAQLKAILEGHDDVPNASEWAEPGEMDAIRKKWGWALKDPEAKMWVTHSGTPEDLGFEHVRDYLDAATEPYTNIRGWDGAARRRYVGPEEAADLNPAHTDTDQLIRQMLNGDDMLPFPLRDMQKWRALNNAGLLIDPEHLPRTSVADAVRKTAKWNEFLANQETELMPGLSKGIAAVHKEYPEEGMRWVRLGSPDLKELPEGVQVYEQPRELGGNPKTGLGYHVGDPSDPVASGEIFKSKEEAVQDYLERYNRTHLEEGLNAEGDAMGHCVGGYCDDVAMRGTEIYSLRDAKGRPHVTVEARPGKPWNERSGVFHDNPELEAPWRQYYADVRNAAGQKVGRVAAGDLNEGNPRLLDREYHISKEMMQGFPQYLQKKFPDVYAKHAHIFEPGAEEIIQIKGKQNAAPADKYLPFVQDFVKSGQWGKVGDLSNTGLKKLPNDWRYKGPEGSQGYVTLEDLKKHHISQGMTEEEAARQAVLFFGDPSYAHGGSVGAYNASDARPQFREMLLARLGE